MYAYDALGRRGVIDDFTSQRYYSDQWQVIQENELEYVTQYVWSQAYVDGIVLRDRDSDQDLQTGNLGVSGSGLDERLYAVQDANYNVTALVNTSGAAVERYQYDPYGSFTVLDPNFSADADGVSDVGWVYLHQGGAYEVATGLYHFRHRDYSPTMGRYTRADPLGYAGGINLYEHIASSPGSATDPFGLAPTINDNNNPPDAVIDPDGGGMLTTVFDSVFSNGIPLSGLTKVTFSFGVYDCSNAKSLNDMGPGGQITGETFWTSAENTKPLEFVIGGRGRMVPSQSLPRDQRDEVALNDDYRMFNHETNAEGTAGYMLLTLETRTYNAPVAALPPLPPGTDHRTQNTLRHDLLEGNLSASTTMPAQWNNPPATTRHSGMLIVWSRCCKPHRVTVLRWGDFGSGVQTQTLTK
jgi:RHS repeat-associated protein